MENILKLSEDGKVLLEVLDKNVNEIIIPQGIEIIGNGAFHGCKSLAKIKIPDTITVINENAFSGCSALQNIDIPSTVTLIGDDVFCNCEALSNINVASDNTCYSSIDGVLFSKDLKKLIKYTTKANFTKYNILYRTATK